MNKIINKKTTQSIRLYIVSLATVFLKIKKFYKFVRQRKAIINVF